jgi:hypothetical protein
MRREDELDGDVGGRPRKRFAVDPGLLETRERLRQRLARDALLMLVLAPAPQTVVLLRQVREREVGGERSHNRSLCVEVEPAHGLAELVARLTGAARARQCPDPLLGLEQRLAFLLDENAAEDPAQETDVTAERSLAVAGVRHSALAPAQRLMSLSVA